VETRPHGLRLSLRDSRTANRPNWPAPRVARLTFRYKQKPLRGVDDRERLRSVLMPLTGPAGPGAYDFCPRCLVQVDRRRWLLRIAV
jgi:hypothetical protein